MVLGNIMIRLVSMAVLFSSFLGCEAAQNYKIDRFVYVIKDNSGLCQIEVGPVKKIVNLKIPYPCNFHLGKDQKIRIIEQKNNKYIILEHSIPHSELPDDCKTSLQAVMISDTQVKASEYFDVVASCTPYQWDVKIFTAMFK